MTVAILSQGEMLELANKVVGDEAGLKSLIRDIKARVQQATREEKAAENDMERLKSVIVARKTDRTNWATFLGILEGLATRWGIDNVEVLPSKERTQEDPSPAPVPQKVDSESQLRMKEQEFCMYKDQKTKKWCPTKLTSSRKKRGLTYCPKHHTMVYSEGA